MQEGNLFLPWYNFALIDFLNNYIKPNMMIFEFGCGFSTLFYAQKKSIVKSFETKHEWVEKITKMGNDANLQNNFSIEYVEPHNLASSILNEKSIFDIIVIDSYHRLECLKNAKKVYQKGLIILDNSERQNLQSANNIMNDFQYKIFKGNGTNREGESQSTVFFRT